MKKSLLYIPALAFVAFGLFSAFNDPAAPAADASKMTDEQKIEASYQAKVTAFNATKDAECKATAMSEATTQFTALSEQAIAAAQVPIKGSKKGTKTTTTTGTQTTTTVPTKTTTVAVDPQKDRGGSTTTTTQKERGGATTTTTQKERGGATTTTGGK